MWKPMACVHSAHPLGSPHEILQLLLLTLHAPAQGWKSLIVSIFPLFFLGKNKSKVITSGLGYSGTEEGKALPRQWALLTPVPWVRFLVFSKGLMFLQLYPQ